MMAKQLHPNFPCLNKGKKPVKILANEINVIQIFQFSMLAALKYNCIVLYIFYPFLDKM